MLTCFIGSIPTAYIARHLIKGEDIRQMGDRNVGAANTNHSQPSNINPHYQP
ncbi:glycerol-3-phosphate acyltransferase [Chloroflexota bacterium]